MKPKAPTERRKFVERRRRPDPVALGNWGKMLRSAIDGTASPESTVPSPQSGEVERRRLPYADE
jgi:hypothetical protein